ncbi:helix-turn-helix domain-containing protein [Viridibacillus sp. YIM B01967]|uniref:Helix-turn-helix domain-containing protein n=1 Tax=Viridibacillus soli TaxID=2798301 RepID=A0ABS1HCX3_9BACL|nr:helix-turn-helix domain-containing protein [Viridibacillus soli]MBK3497254.1 helix-turn-helix domain-containing protein [Viridibacillus soli]
MYFQHLLLQIFHKFGGERSVSAGFHLLKGKRSGQTIQDVGNFNLHAFFGLTPKLSKEKYLDQAEQLVGKGYATYKDEQFFILTNAGREKANGSKMMQFNGWYYRGNEHIFFKRLSLVIQSLSYSVQEVKSFAPIQKNEDIQLWVKHYLVKNNYKSNAFIQTIRDEISDSLKGLPVEESSLNLLLYRLTGFNTPGWTWEQLAREQESTLLDVQLAFLEVLHAWLDALYKGPKYYLSQLAEGIRIEQLLTESAQKTANLFHQGYTLEQISAIRRLKGSTIEDHLVEMAMSLQEFPLEQFVAQQDVEAIVYAVQQMNSKKLKVLRDSMPELSYFQIRLILAAKGVM